MRETGDRAAYYRFFQRDVRDFTGWPDYQVKLHLRKLVDMEYVLVHRGGRGQSFVYELLYRGEGENGGAFVMGLADLGRVAGTTNDRDSVAAERDTENRERSTRRTGEEYARDTRGTVAPIARNVSLDAGSSASEASAAAETLMFPKPAPKSKSKSYRLRRSGGNGRDHEPPASWPVTAAERPSDGPQTQRETANRRSGRSARALTARRDVPRRAAHDEPVEMDGRQRRSRSTSSSSGAVNEASRERAK